MRSQLMGLAAASSVAFVLCAPLMADGEMGNGGPESPGAHPVPAGSAGGASQAALTPKPVTPKPAKGPAVDGLARDGAAGVADKALVARAHTERAVTPATPATPATMEPPDRRVPIAPQQGAQISNGVSNDGTTDRQALAAVPEPVPEVVRPDGGLARSAREQKRPSARRRLPWRPRRRLGVQAAGRASAAGRMRPRRALGVRQLRSLGLRGSGRTDIPLEAWPREPASPATVDRAAFYGAVKALCPRELTKPRALELAEGAIEAAEAFQVDPFLLVAYASNQSGCKARSYDSWGAGLTRLQFGMHRTAVRNGAYHYKRKGPEGWQEVSLDLQGHRLSRRVLLKARPNLFFAAAFLKVAQDQCPHIDEPFSSSPHRHPVSHLVYGDTVRSALPEALILTERRRLLGYYRGEGKSAPEPAISVLRGPPMVLPLDGSPRIVTGLMGDPRDGGRRTHYGIDLPAVVGEPVRAVADGVVVFAGADLRGRGPVVLPPERIASMRERLGPRGVFVRVAHRGGMTSLYVHLAGYRVRPGQLIHRGDALGTVGLTGVHTSDAHLHFGLFKDNMPVDPMRYLGPLLRVNRTAVPGVDVWQAPLRRSAHQPLEAL